jgi:hypothetical protein
VAKKTTIDFTDFHDKGSKPPKKGPSAREAKSWWNLADDALPGTLTDILTTLRQRQSILTTQRQMSARMYCNQNPMGYWGLSANRLLTQSPAARGRLRYNVIKSVCDTVQAKIAKNHPLPLFLTNGAHYRMRRRAQKLSDACKGIFEENRVEELAPRWCMDSELQGSAFIHVYDEFDRVRFERVMADEIWCDELQAFTGLPRSLFRVKHVDRDQLIAALGEAQKGNKKAIEEAESATQQELGGTSYVSIPVSDLIQVCEAWHLPSGPGMKDGAHVIAIHDAVLLREKWTRSYYPFAKLDWSSKPWGYFGIALAEEIEPQQLDINRTLWTIQESQMAMGSFKLWTKTGSQIDVNHLSDEIGAIIESSECPQYITPPIVQPEIYQHLEATIAKAYQQAGLSQAQSTGQNPLGPNASGAAIRELEYVENDRFQIFGQAYERGHVDLGRLAIDAAHDIAVKTGKPYEFSVSERQFLKRYSLTAQELELDERECRLQVFPVSSLPNTPAARMQTVTELVQAGWLSPRQGRRLMRFPDLEQVGALQDAIEERIHDCLEVIIDDGEYQPPDSYMQLDLAKEIVVEYVNLYSTPSLELEEEKLDLLYQWSDHVDYLVQRAMPPAVPGAPGAVPQVGPVPQAPSPMVQAMPGVQGQAVAS